MAKRILLAVSCVALLGVAVGVLAFSPDPWRWVIGSILLIGGGLAGTGYLQRSWQEYVADDIGDSAKIGHPALGTTIARSRELPAMEASVAVDLVLMIIDPTDYFERISETVEPLSRSVSVTMTAVVRLNGTAEQWVAIPVLLRPRGRVEDGVRFEGPVGRLTSMTQGEAASHILSALRAIIAASGEKALAKYESSIEPDVALLLVSDDPKEASFVSRIADAIGKLPGSHRATTLAVAARFVRRLQSSIPVLVPVRLGNGDRAPGIHVGSGKADFRIRISVRRRTIVRVNYKKTSVASKRRSRVEWIRSLFGIRPTTINVPLVNAERSSSYHLQVVGPEHTYLARQSVIDDDERPANWPGLLHASQRLGQRHAHLYSRNVTGGGDLVYRAQFFERMPGSMAPAAASALSVAVLLWLAFCAIVIADETMGSWEFAALVLAFPAAISLWLGVDPDRRLLQGVLVSRASTLVTIGLAVWAAWFNMTADDRSHAWWAFLAGIASLNALLACVSWFMRARLQSTFVAGGFDDK